MNTFINPTHFKMTITKDPVIKSLEETLQRVNSLSPSTVKEIISLSEKYLFRCDGNDFCPIDFDDLVVNEFGFSDYTLSTIIVDGEIGNIFDYLKGDLEDEEGEEKAMKLLRDIDVVVYQKGYRKEEN